MFYVYVLKNEFDWIYVGQTNNSENRLKRHNNGMVRSTKSRIPFQVIYQEFYEARGEAVRREKELKGGQGRSWIKKEFVDK